MKKKPVLTFELITRSTWGISLAQLLPTAVWDTLRKEVYSRANYACEVCFASGVRVHAHEVWQYDDKRKLQMLVSLVCLCEDCHNIKHMGRTQEMVNKGQLPRDYLDELKKHYCSVNGCTLTDYAVNFAKASDINYKRNKKNYTVNWGKYNPEKIVEKWRKTRKDSL